MTALNPVVYDDALRTRVRENLSRHVVREHPLDGRRHAAVAVVLVDSDPVAHGRDDLLPPGWNDDVRKIPGLAPGEAPSGSVAGTAGGAAFLLTRRTPRLNSHGGQWALPGGRAEPNETVIETALRETAEEIGLELTPDACLGRLDDYPTRSGYVISPVVFWGGADPDLEAQPSEVSSIHRIGLHELLREDSPRFVTIPESDRPVIQLAIGDDLVHAPTAAPLYQLRLVGLQGGDGRVDQYEQPVFAWR